MSKNIERDKFLTEAMGECWHEFYPNKILIEETKCLKCGYKTVNPSLANNKYFDTWNGFGKLITWVKSNSDLWQKIRWNVTMADFMEYASDPDKAADALYEYLKSKK